MIAYVRGKVLTVTEETAVVDVNGLGYELYCSGSALNKCIVGSYVELYTYLQVKEDGITLFGFANDREKQLFMKITSVSGVGPKLGISILTSLSADELAQAIATADIKRLSSAKGLGKKTAEKLVLELHGKISATEIISASGETPLASAQVAMPLSHDDEEAISALMGLGFTKNESAQAVKRARDSGAVSVEDIIRKALTGL